MSQIHEDKDLEVYLDLVIDEIWIKHDMNGDGSLNKDETRMFLIACGVGQKGQNVENDPYSEQAFEEIYSYIDDNGNGYIEKAELKLFILDFILKRKMY